MAVKMRLIGGEWGAKMAPENEGIGTTLATSKGVNTEGVNTNGGFVNRLRMSSLARS